MFSLLAILAGPAVQDPAAETKALADCAPTTLEATFVCLDTHWTSRAEYKALSYDDTVMAHFGIGMWMRNNWGLWGGGPLARHFNEMGIEHPDDMSGIILKSYWLYLHDCPQGVDEQVAFYRDYWDRSEGEDSIPEPILDCTAGASAQ
ncbi:DUF6794 domain-containing protein [Brevundimonas sp. A19_0]|uniref:DUF6794 domain-containing protein n=1 Tax=Brevundimonas sp. A19_0 TaxID=2821087 RepID=UPI001ADB094E|nr:DUF6794 domain-containing protein [Brevundimonas sp. A19_0]MBO9500701.1 hypothetical protein [Brevundimonas sp. A19_0]